MRQRSRRKRLHNEIISTFGILGLIIIVCLSGGCSAGKKNRHEQVRNHSYENVAVNPDFRNLSQSRRLLIKEAQEWLGTPYAYAHADKKRGSDCSGMIVRVYEDVLGIKLPRNSAQQAEYCQAIGLREILPGDLVFFATGKDPNRISHVGIMLDYENFIHVSTSKGAVISKITTPYYIRTFMGFGKVPSL